MIKNAKNILDNLLKMFIIKHNSAGEPAVPIQLNTCYRRE